MNVLDFCPKLPQRQDSLNDQLNDLMRVGNKMGLYDAVTFIFDRERWEDVPTIVTARAAHNDSLDRIEAAVTERVRELEDALGQLMDSYEYHVACDHNYERAEKILNKQEEK